MVKVNLTLKSQEGLCLRASDEHVIALERCWKLLSLPNQGNLKVLFRVVLSLAKYFQGIPVSAVGMITIMIN